MDSSFWIKPGLLVFCGEAFDVSPHAHHALQVVIPEPGADLSCRFENSVVSGGVVIAAAVTHELRMSGGWIILVEPQSRLGRKLSTFLATMPYKPVNDSLVEMSRSKDPMLNLDSFFRFLDLKQDEIAEELRSDHSLDSRLQKLLSRLDACFQGECLKPSHWRASEIAGELALSESRFLHLFREQMGVAWRPYLLWRRLICAVQAMRLGATATEAAYKAGFSDSAHLSRNFRRHFGINIREATRMFS
ncbi:hypothetical protein BTA51_24460 [Hahella sp. CCB-MM4]|nr:hypothetical protein BTA51_24460 [Hahella sp. CCB-MM4]